MKVFLTLLALIVLKTTNAQISKGSNFISISNTVFNKPITRFEQYPDTTLSDSVTPTGASISLMFNYNFAVSNRFTIGFKSRFLTDKESTYGISAFGPSFRYYFGFGPDEPRPKVYRVSEEDRSKKAGNGLPVHNVRRFYRFETKERLKSFFFVEASHLFGNLRFDGNSVAYGESGFLAGAMLRFATPETKVIRHFGIELAAGGFRVSDEFQNTQILPNVHLGLLFFLDRKYTLHKRIRREVVYVSEE